MLSAIREIGKWQIEKFGKNELDVIIREPNFRNGGKVVLIKINLYDNAFEGIELEDYDGVDDPLNEDEMSPVPNITHRYPDRVLLYPTPQCGG